MMHDRPEGPRRPGRISAIPSRAFSRVSCPRCRGLPDNSRWNHSFTYRNAYARAIGNYVYSRAPRETRPTTNNGDLCQWARHAGGRWFNTLSPDIRRHKTCSIPWWIAPARLAFATWLALLPGNRNSIKSSPHDSVTTTLSILHSARYSASNWIVCLSSSVSGSRVFFNTSLIPPFYEIFRWKTRELPMFFCLPHPNMFRYIAYITLLHLYARTRATRVHGINTNARPAKYRGEWHLFHARTSIFCRDTNIQQRRLDRMGERWKRVRYTL